MLLSVLRIASAVISRILYEPLGMGRLGIRLADEEVVYATDPSTFAFMLEEFVSTGAVQICVRASNAEAARVPQLPPVLRHSVEVLSDVHERGAVRRLLAPLRDELGVGESDDGRLSFPEAMPSKIRDAVGNVHHALLRLAIGLNHAVQIDLNLQRIEAALALLREEAIRTESRGIVARIQAIVGSYETINLEAPRLKSDVPAELIEVFDRLINDSTYLGYSESIFDLTLPEARPAALLRARSAALQVAQKPILKAGWNLARAAIMAYTGASVPEAASFMGFFGDSRLPLIVNQGEARRKAVAAWSSRAKTIPFQPEGDEASSALWIAPTRPHGGWTVGDLKSLLEEYEARKGN